MWVDRGLIHSVCKILMVVPNHCEYTTGCFKATANVLTNPRECVFYNHCSIVGIPCYPKWYWNHGIIQMAVRDRLALVIIPWSYTDPAYGCYPPMLLSGAGGQRYGGSLGDSLEMIRGALVLHTRGYNAAKPLSNTSNFGRLYHGMRDRVKRIAATNDWTSYTVETAGVKHLFRKIGARNASMCAAVSESMTRYAQCYRV